MKTELIYFILVLLSTFVITAVSARILIPKLKSHKMGQKILDVGPRWHKSKEGTPTMGGLSFLIATVIVFAIAAVTAFLRDESINMIKLLITFIMVLLNCMIGIIDDYTKFIRKQNEGLKASQKYLMQLLVAAAYLFAMTVSGCIDTSMYIPFAGITLELGWFYYVAAFIVITGIVNCVNLTDGIDGLASTVTLVVGAFFAVVSFCSGLLAETIMSALLIGSCLGFLVYNFYPAKIFMGDTGSLFLGAMVTGLAFMINNPLIIIIAGIIYVIEGTSVILQVGYFKLTHGKRLFKMSPIHHHFEKSGWSEIKIVTVFSLITLAACVLAFIGTGI